jgi:DNA/RNA endonuclease YhcR with UshA esterase domain
MERDMSMNGHRLCSVLLSTIVVLLFCIVPSCTKIGEPYTLPDSSPPVSSNSIKSSSEIPLEESEIPEIQWNEARDYIGVEVIVCGPVVDSKWASGSNGKPTFLNLGKPYPEPDRFTIVIWEDYRDNFPAPPEELYDGKTVCVTGIIDEYKNSTQIELRSPSNIEIK